MGSPSTTTTDSIIMHGTSFIVRNEHDKVLARGFRRKRGPASPAENREREINVVIRHVFGASLPDDDFGRDVLFELLNQLALRGASVAEMRNRAQGDDR
jgi:hypothetical protein